MADDRWRFLSNSPTLSQFTTSVTTLGRQPTLKVAKSSVNKTGETLQLVRPEVEDDFDSNADEIVSNLVGMYGTKKQEISEIKEDIKTVNQAFPRLATQIMQTGGHLVSDNRQDLIGEKYLSEQIRLVQEQQKKSSFLDKWGHLLYEGESEKTYQSCYQAPQLNGMDWRNVKPIKTTQFTINNTK